MVLSLSFCIESWMSALPRDFILRLVSICKNVIVQILNTAQQSNSEVRKRDQFCHSLKFDHPA